MSVVGALPSQLHVVLSQQLVGLEGKLIDVPRDFICMLNMISHNISAVLSINE